MKRTTFNWGVLLIAVGASMWGTDALFRTEPTKIMGAWSIVLAEHLVLALYAIPAVALAWATVQRLRPLQWGAVLLIAWGASGLATVLFTQGFATGDPTTVVLLQKTQPLFAIVLARLALGERLTLAYWPCFVVAMVGTYLVAFSSLEPIWRLPQASINAALLALGAAFLWGAGTVLGRFMLADVPFETLTGLRFLLALPFLAVLALPENGFGQVATGFAQLPGHLILMALIPGLLGMLLYYRGLLRTPASVATLAELAFPFTAVMVGWLFLNRAPSGTQLFGFALLWAALLALSRLDAAHGEVRPVEQPAGAVSVSGT
jgi:drug/metabolite transporter (DMT)-like permease